MTRDDERVVLMGLRWFFGSIWFEDWEVVLEKRLLRGVDESWLLTDLEIEGLLLISVKEEYLVEHDIH